LAGTLLLVALAIIGTGAGARAGAGVGCGPIATPTAKSNARLLNTASPAWASTFDTGLSGDAPSQLATSG
jgi:hypothetical protein